MFDDQLDFFDLAQDNLSTRTNKTLEGLRAQDEALSEQIALSRQNSIPNNKLTGRQIAGALIGSLLPLILGRAFIGREGTSAVIPSVADSTNSYFDNVNQQNEDRAKIAALNTQELQRQQATLRKEVVDTQQNYINQAATTDRAKGTAGMNAATNIAIGDRFNTAQANQNDRFNISQENIANRTVVNNQVKHFTSNLNNARQKGYDEYKTIDTLYSEMIDILEANNGIPRVGKVAARYKSLSDALMPLLRKKQNTGAALNQFEAELLDRTVGNKPLSTEMLDEALGIRVADQIKASRDFNRQVGAKIEKEIGQPPEGSGLNFTPYFDSSASASIAPEQEQILGEVSSLVGQTASEKKAQQIIVDLINNGQTLQAQQALQSYYSRGGR